MIFCLRASKITVDPGVPHNCIQPTCSNKKQGSLNKEKNATYHCAVHSTHTQPEPETAGLQEGLTDNSRNAAPKAPDKFGVLEHAEPQRCDATHIATMQGDRLTAKHPSIIWLHD